MNATSNFDPGMCISRQLNQTRWDQGETLIFPCKDCPSQTYVMNIFR